MIKVHVEIAGRTYAAARADAIRKGAWVLSGKRGAGFVALPRENGRLSVWNKYMTKPAMYGLELAESCNTLIVHRHPGNHHAPCVARKEVS
jgi:hypothetical protein